MVYNDNSRELMYNRHRKKVLHAKSEVDSSPPKLNIYTFLKLSKQKEDADRHDKVMKENINMQEKINIIMRSYGRIRTFQKVCAPRSSISYKVKMLRELEKKNMFLGRRVLCMKHEVSTRRPPVCPPKKEKNAWKIVKPEIFEFPEMILAKYKNLQVPDDEKEQRRLLRPRVYLDLAIKDNRPLGRVIIQLFTEACPQVVLEFVRMCKAGDYNRIKVIRLFPGLWLESELQLLEESMPRIEYDMRAVDHNQSAGVLSFPRRHLDGIEDGKVNFSINFRSMNVLNGRRVGFGVVKAGNRMLASLQPYGTKYGKALKHIVLTGCGILPPIRASELP